MSEENNNKLEDQDLENLTSEKDEPKRSKITRNCGTRKF